MTEKVTIGYNEYIITTHTHITNKKKLCPICLLRFFFSRKNDSQQKSEFSHTFRIVQNIFFAILLLSLRSFLWLKDSISKSLTVFQGFISYGANTFIHEILFKV